MMWLKSAIRIPSSGCIWLPRTGHCSRLINTFCDPSRIEKHGGTIDAETRQRTGIAFGVFVVEIIEAFLICRRHGEELHALPAAFGFARLTGGQRLLRQRRFPYGD